MVLLCFSFPKKDHLQWAHAVCFGFTKESDALKLDFSGMYCAE